MGVDGAAVQLTDGIVYRASALGHCTRALAAARQGLEAWDKGVPAQLQAVYDRGNRLEDYVLGEGGAITNAYVVSNREATVALSVTGQIRVVGHIDAKLTHKGSSWEGIGEVKSQNEKEFAKDSIRDSMWWEKYKWQFATYMLATDQRLVCIRVLDAEGTGRQVKFEYFNEPPQTKTDILKRVLEVEQLARQELRGVECDNGGEAFGCPYWKLLHADREKQELEIRTVNDQDFADTAVLYEGLRRERGIVEGKEKRARTKLLGMVPVNSVTTDEVQGVTVKVTESNMKEKVVPPGKMVRVSVVVPKREGEIGGNDGDE